MTNYKKGSIVTGRVTGIEKYGIFVSLDDYNNGLIHISEISNSFVRNPADYVQIGEVINSRVIEDTDGDSCHVKLSIKDLDYRITKSKKTKIKETPLGFETLNNQLNAWINAKEKEIMQKK
ncbi:MAG: S1 RNA-binding domain-containing protein [Firmicutes bacterium]|nr:S1 RNA-binding domain-containing protein [Bacillota bacterium]